MATDYFTMMEKVLGSYGDGVEEARLRQRQIAADNRATTEWDQKQEERGYQLGERAKMDSAFGSYEALGKGVIDGAKADFGGAGMQGMGPVPQAQMPPLTTGLAPQRAATGREMLDARRGIATVSKDVKALTGIEAEGKELDWTDNFTKNLKAYKGTPEQLEAGSAHINQNSNSITLGQRGKDGRLDVSVVKPDGKAAFMRLSHQDQARMFAAGQMSDVDPERAYKAMADINKDLAAAYARDNGLNVEFAKFDDGRIKDDAKIKHDANTLAETARYHSGVLGNQRAELKIRGDQVKNAEAKVLRDNWAPIGVSQDGKGLVVYDKSTHTTRVEPMPPGTDASDLFSRLTGAKQPVSNTDLMSFIEKVAPTMPSNVRNEATGKPYMVSELPMEQQRVAAQQFFDRRGSGGAGGSALDKAIAARGAGTPGEPGATGGMKPASEPALTSASTKLLSSAGGGGYNVELPGGRTAVMSRSELERIGYRFNAR